MERTLEKVAHDDFDFQAFLGRAGEGKTVSTFHKNETVFAQGDPADSIFHIQKGRVKLVVLPEQGKEAVVGILEPGQFFGEGCLNDQTLRFPRPGRWKSV
jgi:CRP/FNR family cyclic AMP-dependent transcriptional regulator